MAITRELIRTNIAEQRFDSIWDLKLNTDAYRIALRYLFDPVSAVAIGKIDPLPHQVEAFVKMMAMLRPSTGIDERIRMLLADDVGLGKTIMIGLVMKELILRKKVDRILIICPSGLQIQWREEMKEKFSEDFTIIKGKIEGNPFEEHKRVIVSVDIGRNEGKTQLLLGCDWDLVIFDEAHRLKPGSLRYEAVAQPIAERTRHLILASATPHDGKVENFLALIQLIDKEVEANAESGDLRNYLEPKMIRRLKEEIVDFRGKKIFPSRDTPQTVQIDYSPEEREFYDLVEDYVRRFYKGAEDAGNYNVMLALYILHRRVSSSLKAGVVSLEKRRIRLLEPYLDIDPNAAQDYYTSADEGDDQRREEIEEAILGATASITREETREEIQYLESLIEMGRRLVAEDKDQKCDKLLALIRDIRDRRPDDKIIIFTEFRDTLNFLERKITEEGLLVARIRGGMSPEDKQQQASYFENHADILLGTEAAGEGLNLQFANIAINYELPWNPNRLEQRVGRVYRYGQKKRVYIYNFKTAFPIDDAVLSKILEKMEHIRAIFQDRAIDVIGSMISEKDMLEIFRISRTDSSAVENVDQLFNDKLEIFKSIDKFLIRQQFNLVNVKQMTEDITRCINNFDIERFFLTYAGSVTDMEVMPKENGQYSIHMLPRIPRSTTNCIEWSGEAYHEMHVEKGVFDPNNKGIHISLGHPLMKAALDDCLTKSPLSCAAYPKRGVLLTYIIRFYDGHGIEIYAEPTLILKTKDSTEILDPLTIWDLSGYRGSPDVHGEDYVALLTDAHSEADLALEDRISSVELFVRKKHQKNLEMEYSFARSEFDWKIRQEQQKRTEFREKGMNWLLEGCDEKIKEYRSKHRELKSHIEEAKQIQWKICGPVNAALLVPMNNPEALNSRSLEEQIAYEKRKREIELAGMRAVEQYERDHGRKPEDVSAETVRGYDILSTSQTERRLIEVKSFATTGPIEISSNEWRTAMQERDDYYLYVVEQTKTTPLVTVIQDPYLNLDGYVMQKRIEDFKVVLPSLYADITIKDRSVVCIDKGGTS